MEIRHFLLVLAFVFFAGGLRAQSFTEQEVVIHIAGMEEGHLATDSMRLAGTLTLPKGVEGKVPAVILITGSGAQNRDEELMGHRPFKVIAEFLSSNGFAVLRCDDRGVGGSTGDMVHATTLDFAQDVQHQLRYLQGQQVLGIDPDRIFLFGHSEGASVAAIVAAANRRAAHPVAGVAMLGGAAVNGEEILLQQNEAIFRLKEVADSLVERRLACMRELFAAMDTIFLGGDADTVKVLNMAFRPIFRKYGEGLSKEEKRQCGLTSVDCYGWAVSMATPWMCAFLRLEPAEYIGQLGCGRPLQAVGGRKDCGRGRGRSLWAVGGEKDCGSGSTMAVDMGGEKDCGSGSTMAVDFEGGKDCGGGCPLLAIGGEKDCQVLPVNLEGIERVCAEHGVPCTIRRMKDVNHLGQKCETGAVEEYAKLGQAPDDEVLNALKQWLLIINKK